MVINEYQGFVTTPRTARVWKPGQDPMSGDEWEFSYSLGLPIGQFITIFDHGDMKVIVAKTPLVTEKDIQRGKKWAEETAKAFDEGNKEIS